MSFENDGTSSPKRTADPLDCNDKQCEAATRMDPP